MWCEMDVKSTWYNKKMKRGGAERASTRGRPDSDEELEIQVKNIDSGEAVNSRELIKHHHSLILNKHTQGAIWKEYLTSVHKMQDKLLALVIHRTQNELTNFLTEYPVDLNQLRYMDGWTLLHFAVGQNDYPTAQVLLRFGLDVDVPTTGMMRTALHEASLGNKAELVRLLVEWGADPNLLDADRNTAIHFAVDYGYEDIVKIILKSKTPVDLNIRNCMNMTTFNTCRNPDIFELLYDYDSKHKKTMSTHETSSTSIVKENSYESRLLIRNSDVFPSTSRVDMVERFLSLREAPPMEKKYSNEMVDSVISEESLEDSLESYDEGLSRSRKGKKRIGGYLRNKSILRSKRIASQNVGLVKESIFMTYLEGKENVDNFDVLRKLGEGSFAQVFLVRRKQSSSLYALKKIDKKIIIENDLRRYVEAEKELLTKIKHPFIIEAYSCLQDFTHLYILMQFCEYGDLEKFIRAQPLPEDIAKTYVCEAALALEEIHQNGFLYRDLKASNILLDKEGHIRLADFGLAKQASTTYSFLGSVSYMAPEMLVEGEQKPHTKAIDWYLLGIFIYELLHGLPPFYTEDRAEMEEYIRTERRPIFDISYSKEVKDLIFKLLQKDPAKRIQSLSELREHLWFKDVDWSAISERKGAVMRLPKLDMKQLRKKQFYESEEDKVIDEKIEWFDSWNYPKSDIGS